MIRGSNRADTREAETLEETGLPVSPDRVAFVLEARGPDDHRRAVAATTRRADACGDGQVRCFNPVFYAIDTVIPLVSLDQRDTRYPDTSTRAGVVMQWWLDIATILGWLLSSIFVLALAGLARSA